MMSMFAKMYIDNLHSMTNHKMILKARKSQNDPQSKKHFQSNLGMYFCLIDEEN